MNHQLPKSTKLRHRTLINHLFEDGKSVYAYPLRLIYREFSKDDLTASFKSAIPEKIDNIQFMITIPKKKQRKAVNRVLLRRRVREAYRLNRPEFSDSFLASKGNDKYLSLAFVYLGDSISDFNHIKEKVESLLEKITAKINSYANDSSL